MSAFTENTVEAAALDWLAGIGYDCVSGAAIAFDAPAAERSDPGYRDAVLAGRLREALRRLNPQLPAETVAEAYRKLADPPGATLLERNRALHRLLVSGVPVEYRRADGSIAGDQAWAIDFAHPENNDWLAVNQFTVVEGQHQRRADVVLFVNGLPLGVLELKNAAGEQATLQSAFHQLQTYQAQIPSLFACNGVLVISDGVKARVGAVGAGREWFKPWRTITGEGDAPKGMAQLQVVLEGVFAPERFLDLLRYFVVFEDAGAGALEKKIAGYHQFHAVNVAVAETLRAAQLPRPGLAADLRGTYRAHPRPGGEPGDQRVGVIWHTQGSGKSLTMAFYAGRLVLHPAMANPTIVVLTDRNDLDEQLFGTFSRCRDLLRQAPKQAADRAHLRDLLATSGGGVVFTTIQKFFPEERGDRHPALSARSNIVVLADEAHRSQYDFIDGFAAHMRDALPNASFIGFTGTPIELTDANTRSVFGEYISVYDIQRAVEDGATVPIYYESRLAKLELREEEKPNIDPDFEEATEGEELEAKEKLKSKWAQLEALVGTDTRLRRVARDLLAHFEERLDTLQGKGMVVCMSRRICVQLYREIVALRPEWHDEADDRGQIKVVMTGTASDPWEFQQHLRSKARREALAQQFRDPDDPFKLVIVRDMWLTGFDAPPLHTMYIDKPMQGHGLMQAIARVNRVFRDKPGGLVVDYLGLADSLRKAVATYTDSGGTGETAIDQAEAVALTLEKLEICRRMFHGFDWSPWLTGTPQQRLSVLPAAQEHILAQPEGKERLAKHVQDLTRAFALAVPADAVQAVRDEVGFYQAVRAALTKTRFNGRSDPGELDHAIRQIVSKAVASEEVIDIFAAAGLKKPDISILSDEFLADVQGLPHRNLAVELLRKLLSGEIRTRSKRNIVQARSFAELLEQAIRKYQNRAIEAAQVIEELIALAKDLREADRRGEELGLTPDEVAFYDALETNDSAVAVLGDETLKAIARELVERVKANVTLDWTLRENVRAHLRTLVKRILRKYGYPPDKQEAATQTVLRQAEVLSAGWAR
jgi:type I restriction enzyme, R subunit